MGRVEPLLGSGPEETNPPRSGSFRAAGGLQAPPASDHRIDPVQLRRPLVPGLAGQGARSFSATSASGRFVSGGGSPWLSKAGGCRAAAGGTNHGDPAYDFGFIRKLIEGHAPFQAPAVPEWRCRKKLPAPSWECCT